MRCGRANAGERRQEDAAPDEEPQRACDAQHEPSAAAEGGELEAHMPHFAAAVGLGTREPAGG